MDERYNLCLMPRVMAHATPCLTPFTIPATSRMCHDILCFVGNICAARAGSAAAVHNAPCKAPCYSCVMVMPEPVPPGKSMPLSVLLSCPVCLSSSLSVLVYYACQKHCFGGRQGGGEAEGGSGSWQASSDEREEAEGMREAEET